MRICLVALFMALLGALSPTGAAFAAGDGSGDAVAAGKQLFSTKCAMCHGAAGDKVPGARLASPEWLSNKGDDGVIQAISKGKLPMMPAQGKAQGGTLSDDDIKAIARYLWNAAGISPEARGADTAQVSPVQSANVDKLNSANTEAVQAAVAPSLSLVAPTNWYRGAEGALSASLPTGAGQPMKGENISFYLDYDFFIGLDSGRVSDSIEIGRAVTDENGMARLKYAPRLAGDLKFEARYAGVTGTNGTVQSGVLVSTAAGKIEDDGHRFYRSDAGIPMPSLVHYSLVETPSLSPAAPFKHLTDLKLPALILGLLIAGIWFTYVRIAYGILRISRVYAMSHVHSTKESFEQTRFFLPVLLMVVLAIFALTLLSIIFTSPDTHLNLR